MAELVMDNPFNGNSAKFGKTVQDIKECVEKLKEDFLETKAPINDDNLDLKRLCAKLEYLLQSGLKTKSGILGGKKDYWNYFCDCINSNKSLNDGIKFVKSITYIRTNLGRGRALIRFALEQQRLADTLQQCIIQHKVTSGWYDSYSVWLDDVISSDIVNCLYELNDLQFDLNSQSYDLDASWPSFTKKPYAVSQTPSRRSSIGSINSLPPLQTSATNGDRPFHIDENRKELLEQQLQSVESAKEQLEAENKALKDKVQESEVKSMDILKKSDGYDVLCEKLANELKMKEELFAEKEQLLQKRLDDAQHTITRLEQNLDQATSLAVMTSQQKESANADLVGLREQMSSTENSNKVLRIDLQRTTKELAAKSMVDAAKGQLVDMQDKKIEQQKREISKLQGRVEELLKDKTTDIEKHIETKTELSKLKADLSDREHAYECLMKSHTELKQMLHSIEKKSSDMGKMAKEKLVKYSEENKSLKSKIEELENGSEKIGVENEETMKSLQGQVTALSQEKVELLDKVSSLEKHVADQAAVIKSTDLSSISSKEEITNLKLVVESLQSESGSKELELTNALLEKQLESKKLTEEVLNLKTTKEDLESTLKSHTSEWNQEKEQLIQDVEAKSKQLELINVNLNDKMSNFKQCENEMKAEKDLLVEQLENQSSEISKLRQELTELSTLLGQASVDEVDGDDSLENLSQRMLSVIQTKSRLENLVKKMEDENKIVHENVKLNDENYRKLAEELEVNKAERETFIERLKLIEETAKQLQLQLDSKHEEIEKLLSLQKEYQSQIESLETLVSEKAQVNVEKNLESDNKDKLIEAKEVQCKGLIEKTSLMQLLVEKLEEEKAEAEETVLQLQAEIKDKDTLIYSTNTELSCNKNHLEDLKFELQTVQKQLQDAQDVISEKMALDNEREAEKVDLMKNSSKANDHLKEIVVEKANLEKQLEKLKSQIEQHEKTETEIKQLNSDLKNKIDDLEKNDLQQQESYSAKKKAFDTKISNYQSEIQHLQEGKTKMTSKIIVLEENCDKSMQEVSRLEKENISLTDCLKKVEGDSAILLSKNEALNEEAKKLKNTINEASTLQMELLSQAETKSQMLESKEDEIAELSIKVQELNTTLSSEREQVEKLTLETTNLNQQIEENEKEKCTLSETINASYFELKEKLGQLECENEALRDEIQTATAEKEKMFANISSQKDELEYNLGMKEKEIQEKDVLVTDLQKNIERELEEKEAFKISMTEKDTRISELNEETKRLVAQMEEFKQEQESKVEENTQEIQSVNSLLSECQAKLEEKDNELLSLKNTHEQEIKTMHFQLSTEQIQSENSLQAFQKKQEDIESMNKRILDLEENLEELQSKLDVSENELEEKVKCHKLKVGEMQEKMLHKDHECQLLAEKLIQRNQLVEQDRSDLNSMELEKKESLDQVEKLQSNLSEVQAENIELKKKIIQLIREKDSLWKKSDKLEVRQKIMKSQISGVWADSSEITQCSKCHVQFGFTVRKHHCRLCGQIFCYYCSNNWVMTSFSNKQERVCEECYMQQSSLELNSDIENSDDDKLFVEQSVEIPSLKSPKWKESLAETNDSDENIEVSVEHHIVPQESTLEKEKTVECNEATGGQSTFEIESSMDDSKLMNMTDESKSGHLNKLSREERESSVAPSDEGYDLITTDEVVQSINTPVPDPHMTMSTLLTAADFLDEGIVGPPDLWIPAGKAYAVTVNLERKGTCLKWEFTTSPKDINFGMTYRSCEWTSFEECETLIPSCKCNSHKKPTEGELLARKPGIYTLIFDNKSSKFTSKKLVYKLHMKVSDGDVD